MREPRPISGAKTPLFDRLLDDGMNVRQPVSPTRAFDMVRLRESVRADLVRLLNTRTNLRGNIRELAHRHSTRLRNARSLPYFPR